MEARELLKEQSALLNEYGAMIEKKWSPLLEGVEAGEKRRLIALMLENEARTLKQEATTSDNVGAYNKFILPVVKKAWANMIADQIVSVQPMTAPAGAIFYMKYLYESAKGSIAAGTEMQSNIDIYYSSEMVNGEVLATADGTATTFAGFLAWTPVKPSTVKITAGSVVLTDDGSGNLTGTGGSGTIDYNTGEYSITYSSAPADDTAITADYTYNSELNEKQPSVKIDIIMEAIAAQTRRLRTMWSPEAAEDLKAYHGLDAENAIVEALANEISLEVDGEIINDIYNLAEAGTAKDTFDYTAPTGVPIKTHLESIITTISTVSHAIYKKTLRRPANILVASAEAVALLDTLSTFEGVDDTNTVFNFGIVKAGNLQNKWTVFSTPTLPKNKIIALYKGVTFLEAGYVYAPYVPITLSQTMLDLRDNSIRKSIRTRYAKKAVDPNYYGVITIDNMP